MVGENTIDDWTVKNDNNDGKIHDTMNVPF
jgi:hypothetical protein